MTWSNDNQTLTIVPEKSAFQKFIYFNFHAAFWLFAIYLAYKGIDGIVNPPEGGYRGARYGRRVMGSGFGAITVLLVNLMLWWFFYRKNDSAAKIFAAMIGIMIFIGALIVPALVADVSGKETNSMLTWFGLYLSVSHLLFGFFYQLNSYKKTIIL